MGTKLQRMLEKKLAKEGTEGRLKLALAICTGERMVVRYAKGQSKPHPETARKLAKACGATDREAELIKSECLSRRAKATKAS